MRPGRDRRCARPPLSQIEDEDEDEHDSLRPGFEDEDEDDSLCRAGEDDSLRRGFEDEDEDEDDSTGPNCPMNTSHASALRAFARNLQWVLTLRLAVQMATVWFFAWGVVILALRIFGVQNLYWLTMGLLAVAPLAALAAWRARQQRASLTKIRASYDHLNACGGIIMSAETQDMGAWMAQLPGVAVPRPRWHSGRPLLLLSTSAAFVLITLLLPSRFTHFPGRHLEIGQIVGQLQAEVKLLAQEKIIDAKKATEVKKQLSQLQDDSLGYDPSKTWEALDHIKQSDSDAAQQAAQEALNKTTSMTEAETLAKALEQASDSGMSDATASQAAQDLASMLDAAKLDNGLLNVQIPPKLLAGLTGLNKEQMEKLLQNLEANKGLLSMDMSNLANLKMIDPATLANLQIEGVCNNPNALADYLCTCTNCDKAMICMYCNHPKGGLARGGPGAPMTWSDGASEKDLKFQEHALPPSPHLSQALLIGVAKTAPQLSGSDVLSQHGALDNTAAGGGGANAQVILPEQRQAVQNYFKRDN
ncbi:MAG TPA: hypothetical protein VMF08_23535 [Candidatus Sulfotelmatobacter sp.]|nr:hypothetical protein [Candidatus Sulfotelmatobacter sp.]